MSRTIAVRLDPKEIDQVKKIQGLLQEKYWSAGMDYTFSDALRWLIRRSDDLVERYELEVEKPE